VLSSSTNALAAGAFVAPAVVAPPPSNVPRAQGDDRFDRIFNTLSSDPPSSIADAASPDAATNADAAGAPPQAGRLGKGRSSSIACSKSGKSKEAGKPEESAKSEESKESKQSEESKESGKSAESGKCGASGKFTPNMSVAAGPVPVTAPVDVPQAKADPATGTHLPVEGDPGVRTTAHQGLWRDALSGGKRTDGRAASDTSIDVGGDAAAATGEDAHADAAGASADAAAPAAEAAVPRFARNQPTSAELRVAAGISNDLHAAIRTGAGSTTTGGRDTGDSSDGGSRSASSNAAQASHVAAAAPDVKAAVDAVQMAARAAGSMSAELATAPQLQNLVRASSLEAAAAVALDRDSASVSSQVLESIRLQWARGGGDAQMTLQPGYLGGLSVSLRVDKDVVTASVVAESPAVREWLRANESSLRQGLVDVGLRLEKFHVSDVAAQSPSRDTGARDRPSGRDRHAAARQPRPGRSDSTFEVIAE
jgi:flagellar hook-length control protein FliK